MHAIISTIPVTKFVKYIILRIIKGVLVYMLWCIIKKKNESTHTPNNDDFNVILVSIYFVLKSHHNITLMSIYFSD